MEDKSDSSSTAPNKEERQKCWTARDAYYACLEANNNDKSKCAELRKPMEALCPYVWVKHFDRRRDYLKFREKVEKEGYEPIGEKS